MEIVLYECENACICRRTLRLGRGSRGNNFNKHLFTNSCKCYGKYSQHFPCTQRSCDGDEYITFTYNDYSL